MPTSDEYLTHLERTATTFADVISAADLAAPVAACPGWTLRDLAWHLGGVHRWATFALRHDRPGEETHSGPTDPALLTAWLREGSADLLDVLRATDPATPRWGFGPPPRLAAFWYRRQALETAVHLWDAQAAAGTGVATLSAELAADGVDEVARMFFPRQVRLERCAPLTRSLGLVAQDAGGGAWLLAGDGLTSDGLSGTAREAGGSPPPDAVVRGPAQALLLLLWRRIGIDDPRLTTDGDPGAARAVLAMPIVP